MTTNPWTVDEAAAGTRLDKWLADAARLGSRAKAVDALRKGRVFVDEVEQTVADAGTRLATGQTIRLWMDRPGSASRRGPRQVGGLDIVFEDDALLVANKPAGLPTVPVPDRPDEPSLFSRVQRHWRSHQHREPLVVHRIDGDTSGLVVFAKTPAAYEHLKQQFETQAPLRRYLAFVWGAPQPPEGTWRDALAWNEERRIQLAVSPRVKDARPAVTHYRVLERFAQTSLLELRLETGRQHQIRVQAMHHGHPLLGETLDGGAAGLKASQAHPRQALHATTIRFEHPVSRRPLQLDAPLPDDLAALEERLAATGGQGRRR